MALKIVPTSPLSQRRAHPRKAHNPRLGRLCGINPVDCASAFAQRLEADLRRLKDVQHYTPTEEIGAVFCAMELAAEKLAAFASSRAKARPILHLRALLNTLACDGGERFCEELMPETRAALVDHLSELVQLAAAAVVD